MGMRTLFLCLALFAAFSLASETENDNQFIYEGTSYQDAEWMESYDVVVYYLDTFVFLVGTEGSSLCHQAAAHSYEIVEVTILRVVRLFAATKEMPIEEKRGDVLPHQPVRELREPDFSNVLDSFDCKQYPLDWQIDCLDAVYRNLNEEAEDINELIDAEVTLVRLQIAGMALMTLFAIVALVICCVYFPAKYHEEEAVKYFTSMEENHLPVIYLQPIAYNNY